MKWIVLIFSLFLVTPLMAQTNEVSTETNSVEANTAIETNLFPNAEDIPALDQGVETTADFPPNEPLVDLQYPNNPIQDILAIYEQLTGKRVIKDPNLAGLNFSIMANQIPKSEAIRLIESAMLLNNYAIVPAPDNSIKLLNLAGKQPRSEGIPIYANPNNLPVGEQVVSYFMPLRHLTPAEAVPIFQQAAPPHPYGVYVPVNNAQAVIITENSSVIRQLIALQELIDVPPAKMISQFVTLTRTDAVTVAEAITKLLETRKTGAAQAGAPAAGTPPEVEALFNQGAQASDKNPTLYGSDVKLVPDPRTNRILVITKPSSFAYIKNLIEEFDSATELAEPLELQLKYISASELLPILQDLLKEDEKQNTTTPTTAGARTPTDRQQPTASPTASAEGALNLSDRLAAPSEIQAPEAITVGKTRIIADNRQNTLLVLGPPGSIDKIQSVVEKLDRRPLQVYLATVIGQLVLNDTMEFGVDILQRYESFGKESGGLAAGSFNRTAPIPERPLSAVPDPLSLANGAIPALAGLNIYAAIGSSLNAYVKALEGTGRFKVIQRPFIFTSNNKKATILSGEEVPVPTATVGSLVDSTNNQALNASIQFKDVALKLEVIPLINSEKEVTLQIAQINNVRSGSANVAGIQVPTIAKQELNTSITVSNKAVIVLGGLIREEARRDTTGIPLLSKIPLLGALFRETRKENIRSELLILIQPTVIQDGQDLAEANLEERKRAPFISPETYLMAEPEALRLRIDEEKLKLKKKKREKKKRE